jgi:hypothetical protein
MQLSLPQCSAVENEPRHKHAFSYRDSTWNACKYCYYTKFSLAESRKVLCIHPLLTVLKQNIHIQHAKLVVINETWLSYWWKCSKSVPLTGLRLYIQRDGRTWPLHHDEFRLSKPLQNGKWCTRSPRPEYPDVYERVRRLLHQPPLV